MADGTQEAPVSARPLRVFLSSPLPQVLLETVNYERLVGQGQHLRGAQSRDCGD